MKPLWFVIVSGLSGSGKTTAIKVFEDLGFFCVDNLPTALLTTFADLCSQAKEEVNRIALGVDIRTRGGLGNLPEALQRLTDQGHRVDVLFLEARDDILVRRYSETRRRHPLDTGKLSVVEAIRHEREELRSLRNMATKILDSSEYTIHQLRDVLRSWFVEPEGERGMNVAVMSFGFKYGIPLNADCVFDMRFLPNPHFEPELKEHSGNDRQVIEFVMNNAVATEIMPHLKGLLEASLPHYIDEGKSYLTIGVGCTGGRHRSVVVATEVGGFLKSQGYSVTIHHRDINKG
jgi:UPF0042 nucleotide-binding protein